MPWYRIGGMLVHMRMDKRQRKKAPPACPFFVWENIPSDDGLTVERVKVRCLAMCSYQCDWLGCNIDFCESHRLSIWPNIDVCPTHNHKRGLFSRLLPAPTETP